ncbi:Na+ dependent nucleoside transporter [Brumimicrobium salinarum]|uniref:Na+ dependent nucleoside transporter n=1 Tax=Brumimicrobium salinarum TaxID=2058658 RepID=A0A2I0R4N4_9FLAO|nr:nucleoside transporter C-terminal domain-containing protein [Brumimicrobium salinarum]PKR81518.1 Na+ dependent nucleoside transporter [Brumimicrobium salinarum]
MKLTNVLPKFILLLIGLLTVFIQINAQEVDKNNENQEWFRRKFTLQLNQDGTFKTNDTILTRQKEGNYLIEDNTLILKSEGDSASTTELFPILTMENGKFALDQNENRITYLKENKNLQTTLSFGSIFRGLLGIVSLIFIAFLLSKNKKRINWPLVFKGILLQVVLALLILKVPFIEYGFDFISQAFVKVVDMAHEGAMFVFNSVITGEMSPLVKNFVTWVLPSVIFFSALSSLLYYWGILQKVVYGMAWVMKRLMGLSGAESVSAAGNVFLGQTEAPLLVKPYLGKMTQSEILCLMAGGMATIAGGVLAAYIGFLGGDDPQQKVFFAKHLLTASLMSAPAAIVFSKILLPETEEINKDLSIPKDKLGVNPLEAIANGTTDGLKLAVNVAAMLIVFISLIALANFMLGKLGYYSGLNEIIANHSSLYTELSFQFIVGNLLAPVAWLMGVPWQDTMIIGQLLGEKTIINEFVAYPHLGELQDEITGKSLIIGTYVLCGFANFASIGIQVGGIGALAPSKKPILAKYGVLSLIAGTLACMLTATMVGMLF